MTIANRLHFHFPPIRLECLLLSSMKTKAFFPLTLGMPVNEFQHNYLSGAQSQQGREVGKKWGILSWLPDQGPETYFSIVRTVTYIYYFWVL